MTIRIVPSGFPRPLPEPVWKAPAGAGFEVRPYRSIRVPLRRSRAIRARLPDRKLCSGAAQDGLLAVSPPSTRANCAERSGRGLNSQGARTGIDPASAFGNPNGTLATTRKRLLGLTVPRAFSRRAQEPGWNDPYGHAISLGGAPLQNGSRASSGTSSAVGAIPRHRLRAGSRSTRAPGLVRQLTSHDLGLPPRTSGRHDDAVLTTQGRRSVITHPDHRNDRGAPFRGRPTRRVRRLLLLAAVLFVLATAVPLSARGAQAPRRNPQLQEFGPPAFTAA